MVNVRDMNITETVFEWYGKDGESIFFAVDRMRDWAIRNQDQLFFTLTNVDPVIAEQVRKDGSIDDWKFEKVDKDSFKAPVFYCETRDNYHILVDGRHRYVYAAENGIQLIPSIIFTPDQWEPFVIEQDPDVIMVLL